MNNIHYCRNLRLVCYHSKILSYRGFQTALSDSDVIVVSTASRGIGLEFTKQLLKTTTARVIALHRNLSPSLLELQQQSNNRLHLLEVNLDCQQSVDNVRTEINDYVNAVNGKVRLLLNVSGILGDNSISSPGPERTLKNIDRKWLRQSMSVNVEGHVMITQAMFPLLSSDNPDCISKVINISARVGSIGDNHLGGWYSYRMSKAALNQFTKTFAIEARRYNISTISLHPGTTETSMSRPFIKNVKPEKLFPVALSVKQMLDVIWAIRLDDSGKFLAYDGSVIPY